MIALAAEGVPRRPRGTPRRKDGASEKPPSDPVLLSEADPFVYKMKDLCDKAGVSRQVVHFYIQQGLLPEGRKTGKNMAYYGELHLERLLLVRKLQHENFLPLRAIRALLERKDEAFSPAQQKQLRDVRAAMSEALTGPQGPRQTQDVFALAERLGVPHADVQEMVEAGLFAVAEEQDLQTERRRTVIAQDDIWLLEHYAELHGAGFTAEHGFRPADLLIYEEMVERLVTKEARLVATRLNGTPAEKVALLLERALPIVASLLARLHTERAKNFFATM